MSHDNAAIVRSSPEVSDADTPAVTGEDVFSAMTDRELAEYTARNISRAIAIAEAVQEQVAPVIEKFSKNPLFGGLFR